MKLAVQHTLLPGASLSEKFQQAADLGYDGVELSAWGIAGAITDHADAILAAIKTSGVPVSSFCPGQDDDLVHPDPVARAERVTGLISRLKLADKIGAAGVIALPIRPPTHLPDLSPLADERRLISDLTIAAVSAALDETAEASAKVFLEPLNRYEAYFLRTVGHAAELCRDIGHARATIMADLFHMNIEEASIAGALTTTIGQLGHVHLADSNRLEPGAGHTDFVAAFRVLRTHNFAGWMALECGLSAEPESVLPQAAAYIRECWERAAD